MLNHIWLALIVIGILTAAGRDIYDAAENTYANDIPWTIDVQPGEQHVHLERTFVLPEQQLREHFPSIEAKSVLSLPASVYFINPDKAHARLTVPESAPKPLLDIAEAQGNKNEISGTLTRRDGKWQLVMDPVSFVYLKRITNAAFDAAQLAVTIALGLIGIMALWLGIMKIAEEAGLVKLMARAVKPVTTRLFPDVPHDHPAIASIIMNMAANMLGLGNAATPFGLKAMEELNKINPKSGTATDAMVTFLALNTSCVTLIPATAIAVRAASGSNDPAAIIGTTFLASLTATVVGVTTAKLLQRVRFFRVKPDEEAA